MPSRTTSRRIGRLGPEGHADPDLVGPLGDRIRHDGVETHHGQEETDEALDGGHGRTHAQGHQAEDAFADVPLHGAHVEDREVGVELTKQFLERLDEGARIRRAAYDERDRRAVVLIQGEVEIGARLLGEHHVLAVRRHAHHLDPVAVPAEPEVVADDHRGGLQLIR
jgi:hypothetical protein